MVAVVEPPGEADRARVAAAIRSAEERTSGELVAVMSRASHRYLFEPALAAALAALVVPAILWLPGIVRDFAVVYGVQIAVFALALPFLMWPPVARCLVPPNVRRAMCERAAWEQFYDLGLHRTRQACGVMIYVSLAEHHVQVLADEGIAAKVPPEAWSTIVAGLTTAIRDGHAVDGLVAAVEACGALLATHFPRAADDRNELPDRLVEL